MVMVPSLWRRASCWETVLVPSPISKSLSLPHEAPQDLTTLSSLAESLGRDEEVAVEVYVYGVDVEVVDRRAGVLGGSR